MTGASGFLGRQLVAELLRDRGRVFALSRRPFRFASARVVSLAHDLARPLPRAALPERIRCVYHCASPAGRSRDRARLLAANVTGTRRLVDYAVDAGARRFVYVSSGGVCRRGARPIREDAPLEPDTPYLAAKVAGEKALLGARGRVPVAVVRLFFPYGPGQREGLLPRLCDAILGGEAIHVGRAGGPRLNPVHVRDAARLVRAIATSSEGDVVVNVAGAEPLSLERLARMLARRLGMRARFRCEPVQRPSLVADLRCLRRYGSPRLSLAGGLRSFMESWMAERG